MIRLIRKIKTASASLGVAGSEMPVEVAPICRGFSTLLMTAI
jgi:hypothetical protein